MKEFTIGKNDAGQRLDRWLGKAVPLLPAPLAQKYIRLKRVKLNGKGAKRDTRLNSGDLLALYINDEFFDAPAPENAFLSVFQPQLDIVYEDENLLLVNKRPALWSTLTSMNMSTRSSPIYRPIYTRKMSGIRNRKTPLHQLSATGLTAIPAASLSLQRPQRPCAS